MIKTDFDVAIVGAGPAGTACAIYAALSGLKVVLLEKCAGPEHRPGESLLPGAEIIFKQLGVWETIRQKNFLRYPGHYTAEEDQSTALFHFYGSDSQGPWLDLQIPRFYLDTILQNRATELGVTFMPQCNIKHIDQWLHKFYLSSQDLLLCADYAIDATGHRHFFARKMRIEMIEHSPILIARYGYLNHSPHEKLPIFIKNRYGWKWYTRISEERYAWVSVTDRSVKKNDTYDALGGANVTWRIAKQLAGPRFFMIGDAACVHDPSSGKGVLRAMMSGMMAANIIRDIKKRQPVSQPLAYQRYHHWLHDWFHNDTKELLRRSSNYRVAWL